MAKKNSRKPQAEQNEPAAPETPAAADVVEQDPAGATEAAEGADIPTDGTGETPTPELKDAPPLDPATVEALQDGVQPGDTIVVGNEPDGSDGVEVVVEKIDLDGIHVTPESAEALAAGEISASLPAGVVLEQFPPEKPKGPTIDSVLRAVADKPVCGSVLLRPDVHLTGPQAELQNRIYRTLVDQGLKLRSQGDVYGWLLGTILDALRD